MNKLLLSAAVCAVSFCGFAATHTITSLSDHAGIDKVLKVKTGDTIELPALEVGSYKINNTRVATLDGSTLTVIGPGMLGIQQLDAEDAIVGETAAVLSVPDPIGDGRVFLWNPNHWDSANWCSSETPVWQCLVGEDPTEKDYPHLPNDIAILARYKDWGFDIKICQNISLGGLMVGAYVTDHGDMENNKYRVCGNNDGSINKLTFARTDGKKAFIQICPAARTAGAENGVIKVAFGDGSYPLNIVCASDVELDLGWDGGDSFNTMAYLLFDKGSTLNIPEGKSLALVNGSPFHKDNLFKTVECRGKLTGAGRFVNSGRSAVLADFDATEFTGTLVEAALGREGYDRDAQTFLQNSDTYGNAKLEIDGFVVRSDYKNYPEGQGAGYVRIGQNHTWPGQEKVGNRLPGKEVIFNGGTIRLYNEQKDWGGATNLFITEKLSVANGFTLLEVNGHDNTSYPFTWMKVSTLSHENSTGTLAVRCNRLWRTSHCDNCDVTFGNFSDAAIGGIVPWIAAWMDQADYGNEGGWESLMFPIVDADGNLRDERLASTSVADATDGANVFCDGTGLDISEDKTINSLVLKNGNNGEKKIGEGRTLTIASGGLIMVNRARIGENEWNTDIPSVKCGTLVFGATAYIFANNPNGASDSNMSWIMTPMVAPYGLVSAMAGYLTICGNQTGIDGEIVVNAGELTLGLARNNNGRDLVLPCQIDVPVRIVGGGSKLALTAGTQLDSTQNVYFEDIGGYAGKLVIPEGSTESCAKCYVDNVALNRGTYGATGSGAENIDDDHFSGLGVLNVLKDDHFGLQIYLR